MTTRIFTDGSSLGNPGPGGFCAIIKHEGGKVIVKGGEADTTNNRMEMSAVIAGLAWINMNLPELKECAAVYSDSKLVIESITKGWKRKKNLDLWEKLDRVMREFKKISWHWVKGHSGHPENTEADHIAVKEAEKRSRVRG